MTTKDTATQLEGWLPGDERNGLPRISKDMMDRFNAAFDAGDDTTAATLQVVVGVVEVTKVNRRKHPEEKPPVVAFRFLHIEPVSAALEEATRAILQKMHADRTGNDPLPGLGGDDDADDSEDDSAGETVDATAGDRTDRVTDIGQGRKRTGKKAASPRRRRTPPGQTPRH